MLQRRLSTEQYGAFWAYLGAAAAAMSLVGIVAIWLVPAVVAACSRSPFTRGHALPARNFGVTCLLMILSAVLLSVALRLDVSGSGGLPLPLAVALLYVAVGWVGLLVGMVRAAQGKPFGFLRAISLGRGRPN